MIIIKHLTKQFGDRKIFSDMSFHFETGKIYALTGLSGSGKTTLMNILAKLDGYQKGEIYFQKKSLVKIKNTEFYRKDLGYLFQNFGLLDNESVEKNLELGFVGKKINSKDKLLQEKEVLKMVGLSYLDLKQKIYALSGGEAQRVALAKIILKNPPFILADEPTASLDPKASQEIMDILISLKNPHRLIILATHNPDVWQRADEIVRISDIANVQ